MIKTVSLTADTETKVEISGGYNVGVINRTTGMLYASRKSGIVAGADDVAAIPAGDSYVIRAADDTVYLLATAAGDVQLESIGAKEVFKAAATRTSSGGGEGGAVDKVAREAIESHANNEEIHVTPKERVAWNGKAEMSDIPKALPANGGNADTVNGYHAWELQAVGSDGVPFGHTITANHQADDGRFKFTVNDPTLKTSVDYAYNADTVDGLHANEIASNPNLLINPDFSINQRGQMEYLGAVYGLDGWKGDAYSKVQVLDNGRVRVTVTGAVNTEWYALKQMLEDMPIGTHALSINVTAISGDGWYITASNSHASAHLQEGVNYITVPSFTAAIVGLAIDAGAVVGDYVEFEWMQLEPGTIPTRHVKSNKALELVMCQRYYISAPLEGRPCVSTQDDLWFFFALPTTMRIKPSLNNVKLLMTNALSNVAVDVTDWTVFVQSCNNNGVLIGLHKGSHGLTITDHVLAITEGGLSAEPS